MISDNEMEDANLNSNVNNINTNSHRSNPNLSTNPNDRVNKIESDNQSEQSRDSFNRNRYNNANITNRNFNFDIKHLEQILIPRNILLKYLENDKFEELIIGAFVRINSKGQGYMICQIEGVKKRDIF
mmetsp:Transcript_89959/g.194612  ORF Transcript_89959/g.194612 Transcript_89959/m.194612 type:complete len:128 (+) Transcript_89959:193-576(+)